MENHQEIVRQLEAEAVIEYKSGNTAKAVELEQKAWEALPEPKYEKDRSYLIASAMVFMLKIMQRYDEALTRAKHLMQCNLERQDDGDREFKAGTVLYYLDRKKMPGNILMWPMTDPTGILSKARIKRIWIFLMNNIWRNLVKS